MHYSSCCKLLLAPLACGLLMAAHAAQAQAPNLVTNGGFETGDFTGWTLSGNQDGNTVVSESESDVSGAILLPHSGNYAAFLGAIGSDNLLTQQIIPTIVGDGYVFSYYLASDGDLPNDFTASFGGNTVFTQTNIPQQNYVQYSFTQVATSASTAIQFASRNDPGFLSLDDVSVTDAGPAATAVPEPSSIAAFAVGGLGVLGLVLRRKKAAAAV